MQNCCATYFIPVVRLISAYGAPSVETHVNKGIYTGVAPCEPLKLRIVVWIEFIELSDWLDSMVTVYYQYIC